MPCDLCEKNSVKTTVMIEGVGINVPYKSDAIEKIIRKLLEETHPDDGKLYLEPHLCDKCIASKPVLEIFNKK